MIIDKYNLMKDLETSDSEMDKLALYFINFFTNNDKVYTELSTKSNRTDIKIFYYGPLKEYLFGKRKTHPFSLNVGKNNLTFYFRLNHNYFFEKDANLGIEIIKSKTIKKGGERYVRLKDKNEIKELIEYVFEHKLDLNIIKRSHLNNIEERSESIKNRIEQDELVQIFQHNNNLKNIIDDLKGYEENEAELLIINHKKYKRDNKIIALLKIYRKFECQICGSKIKKADGGYYIEAAHIKPKSEKGSENPNNILILCPNHHKEFDFGKRDILKHTKDYIKFKLNEELYELSLKID